MSRKLKPCEWYLKMIPGEKLCPCGKHSLAKGIFTGCIALKKTA